MDYTKSEIEMGKIEKPGNHKIGKVEIGIAKMSNCEIAKTGFSKPENTKCRKWKK